MDRALVVTESTERGRELIELAGEMVAGMGGQIILLGVIDETEYGRDLERKANTSMEGMDSIDEVEQKAKETAKGLGEDILGDNVSYTVEVLFGKLPDDLLVKANELDADHIFIAGERRSPTGKVLFGDTTQAVLLNFDGPVTSLIS